MGEFLKKCAVQKKSSSVVTSCFLKSFFVFQPIMIQRHKISQLLSVKVFENAFVHRKLCEHANANLFFEVSKRVQVTDRGGSTLEYTRKKKFHITYLFSS